MHASGCSASALPTSPSAADLRRRGLHGRVAPRVRALGRDARAAAEACRLDVKKGLSVLRRQCEETPQACLELAIWLDFPGARAALDGSPARANATYVRGGDRPDQRPGGPGGGAPGGRFRRLAPPWPERRAFLSAMIALGRNDERRVPRGRRAAPEARSPTSR